MSGGGNLEVAQETRKKERMRNGHFFEYLVQNLACIIIN